jgi:hypothetical protein
MFSGKTFKALLGRGYTKSYVSACHVVVCISSAMVTTIYRVALLVINLKLGGNSTTVRLSGNEGGHIYPNVICETVTVVKSSDSVSTYYKSGYEVEMFLNISIHSIYHGGYNGQGGVYYRDKKPFSSEPEFINQTYLVGHDSNWYSFITISKTAGLHLESYDGHRYFKYFYYCDDVSQYLNNTRVPILAWLFVNILPLILFSIINLVYTLQCGCLLASCTNPVLLLSGIFSHLHVGPVTHSGSVCLSKTLSILNILTTFFGMCLHLYLITVQFGPGKSSNLQVTESIMICVSTFILSASLAVCFLHCFCCNVNTELYIFNPSDLDQLYTIDSQNDVLLLKGDH